MINRLKRTAALKKISGLQAVCGLGLVLLRIIVIVCVLRLRRSKAVKKIRFKTFSLPCGEMTEQNVLNFLYCRRCFMWRNMRRGIPPWHRLKQRFVKSTASLSIGLCYWICRTHQTTSKTVYIIPKNICYIQIVLWAFWMERFKRVPVQNMPLVRGNWR